MQELVWLSLIIKLRNPLTVCRIHLQLRNQKQLTFFYPLLQNPRKNICADKTYGTCVRTRNSRKFCKRNFTKDLEHFIELSLDIISCAYSVHSLASANTSNVSVHVIFSTNIERKRRPLRPFSFLALIKRLSVLRTCWL